MKKVFVAIVAALFAVFLVGCSSGSGGTSVKEPSSVVVGSGSSESAADDVNSSESGNSADEAQASESSQQQAGAAEVKETVLVDESGVKITATELTKEMTGPALKLLIENSSGKNLTVQSRGVSVNGYMTEPMFSADVADGKKANDSIKFIQSELDACGIDEIADMEFSFHVFTSDDWENYLDTELISLPTSIADSYSYKYDDSGDVAYDGEGLKIIVKGLSEDASYLGPSIIVEVINERDNGITVQTRDTSVNGFMVDPVFSREVMPGKRSLGTMSFMESSLEENDIETIDDVELSFHVFDYDTWDTIVDTDVVSISF